MNVALGPLPCQTCKMPVAWIRTFDGLLLRGVWYDTLGRRQFSLHECIAVAGQLPLDRLMADEPERVRDFLLAERAKLDEELDAGHPS